MCLVERRRHIILALVFSVFMIFFLFRCDVIARSVFLLLSSIHIFSSRFFFISSIRASKQTTVCGIHLREVFLFFFGSIGPLRLERSLLYICVTAIFHNTIYKYFFFVTVFFCLTNVAGFLHCCYSNADFRISK